MDINHPFPLDVDYDGNYYEGWVTPSEEKGPDGSPISFRVMLNGDFFAYLCCGVRGWAVRDGEEHPKDLVGVIGERIRDFYQRAADEEELERHDGSAGAFSATEMGRDDED
jgi:hypothetical protein